MPETNLTRIFLFLALLCAGLVAGTTFGIWQGYDPRALDAAAFVTVHQGSVHGLNVLLPALGFITIASLAISAWLARRARPALWLLLAALVCMAAGGVITRFINQPINAEVMNWTAASVPQNWQALRETWWNWHIVRTLTTLAGFALLIATVLWGHTSGRAA